MFLITFGLGFSQSPFNTNLSPGGLLENVFDNYGNKYKLTDIKIINANIPTTNRSVLVVCNPTSIFNLYFEPGCGMEGADQAETDRRSVLCQVFKDMSDFLTTSSSPIIVNGNKVNIWVRKISNIQGVPANALGLATSFYVTPSNPTEGGIIDNEIWKTIHTGKDSFINTVPPLTPNAPTTGTSGSYYHCMVAFNFNLNTAGTAPLVDWYTMPLTSVAPNNKYDLYSVVLHEVTHALGFASLMNQLGNSQFGTNFKYYSRYDKFLRNNGNTASLLTNATTTSSMYNYGFNPALNATVLRPGCTNAPTFEATSYSNNTNAADALKYVGNNGSQIPIYTPTCYEKGSSYSHFEDLLVPPNVNDGYFVMSNGGLNATPYNSKRYLKPEERRALCDLGYAVNASFGSTAVKLTATSSGPFSYGTASACGGITVAGTNDGINPVNFLYTFSGNTGVDIPINVGTLLANDTFPAGGTFPQGIEYLQDLTTGVMLLPSGTNASIAMLNSATAGVHLLRYVPTYGTQKGNVTYVYAFIVGSAGNCAQPTACNLVSNGDFEQYSSLVLTTNGDINKSCGWNTANNGSPDYFHTNAVGQSNMYVPCNYFGFQEANNNQGNAYAGLGFSSPLSNPTSVTVENIYTKLTNPLLAGEKYQLSFDVSLAESFSSFGYELQAYLSPTALIQNGYSTYPLPANNVVTTLIDPTIYTNFNVWNNINFNYTASGGEQYLYIGGLQTQQITSNVAALPSLGCTYSGAGNLPQFLPARYSYYYIDNVKLFSASLDLPATLCPTGTLTNLASYLSAGTPTTGVFASASGVSIDPITNFYKFQFPAGVTSAIISYSYTNNLGCSITLQDTITLSNSQITPQLPNISVICQGATPPTLPTSLSGITGSWSPPTISNTASGNYTFTPTAGQCANAVTLSVQIIPTTIAAPTIARICPGGSVPPLPVAITGITGTWSPPTISNTTSGTYTFTPNAGQCASNSVSVFVTVATITPTPPTIARICPGGAVPLLPAAISGITGTWSPPTISNTTSRTYTFTPNAGQCANSVSVYVTVATITPALPNIAPIICQGVAPPQLPATLSGITGTWNPATISNTASGNYTFTPNAGQCANAITINVQVLLPTAFVANDDYLQVNLGGSTTPTTTLSVLYNDSYNGNFNIGTLTGIPPFTIIQSGASIVTPAGGITFNGTTGAFQVAGNTTPGTYVFAYFIRTACYDTAVKTVKIEVGNIVSPFKLGFGFCYRSAGVYNSTYSSTNPTLFDGTTINGVAANPSNSYILPVSPTANPATISVTINANGTITLPAGLLPSFRGLYYQVCAINGGGCSGTIQAGISIGSTVNANPDARTATRAPFGIVSFNVLTNDTYSQPCNLSNPFVPLTLGVNVQIINVVNAAPNFSLDPSTGLVTTVGSTVPAGSYGLSYTLKDLNYPAITATTSVYILVPALRLAYIQTNDDIFDINETIISPNPNNGLVGIKFNSEVLEALTAELYDITGRKLNRINIPEKSLNHNIEMYDYAAGNYILLLLDKNDNNIFHKTLTKM